MSIHKLAKQMVSEGYFGQGLGNEERAEDYILLAAANPNVEEELPPKGFTFWKYCEWQHKVWKARKILGLPEK
jgi:hypothetical protein